MNEDRQNEIFKLMLSQKHKVVTVKQICQKCFVSESSARRDLRKLEKAGLVKRIHGGATIPSRDAYIEGSSDEGILRRMADESVNMISDGNTVFLDTSEFACTIADLLPEFEGLTVITPNIRAITQLSKYSSIKTICVCGVLDNRLVSAGGSYAVDFLDYFYADVAFVTGQAFDLKIGISDISSNDANIKKKMLIRSRKRIILCENSAVGRTAPYIICDAKGFDTLITDNGLSDAFADEFMLNRIDFRCV